MLRYCMIFKFISILFRKGAAYIFTRIKKSNNKGLSKLKGLCSIQLVVDITFLRYTFHRNIPYFRLFVIVIVQSKFLVHLLSHDRPCSSYPTIPYISYNISNKCVYTHAHCKEFIHNPLTAGIQFIEKYF